ncbi:hypothetical protein PIIN_02839 [Serendipita indica DSM 11827]|uniref:DUF7223 domain-containing protein n=1 Tax=Serendipita indica (strain DSM 11827) TaxID=1109443 RepID=G4TCF5_SERID|nr:hypothetical protein PIIN_02839 [Serendipita indica DSM 11827]
MLIKGAFLAFLVAVASAIESTPCTSGSCTYTAGDGVNSAYSVLAINTENPSSLSDITAAAGWDIIECDPDSVGPQDVRLVCTDRSKNCDQLFEGGEENTIVKLPDSCAGGPFARVVKSWIPDNQTLPARLAKRQLDDPVRALTLDFDFAQIPVSKGRIWVTASATNSRTQRDAITRSATKRSIRHATRAGHANAMIRDFVEASQKRNQTAKPRRGFFDGIKDAFNGAVDAVKGAAQQVGDALQGAGNTVANGVQDAAHTVADGVQDAAEAVQDGIHKAGDSIGDIVETAAGAVSDFVHSLDDATGFNETLSKNFHVIDIDQSFPVFSASIDCPSSGVVPALGAGVSVSAAVQAKLDAEVGFIVTGSIVPPQIDDLAFTSVLRGKLGATFDVKANAKGTFDTGAVPLLQTGLPGLSFPGILTVGPSISLNAQAKAYLGITADINIASSMDIPQINLVFPPSQGQNAAQVVPGETPINVKVGASAELQGRAEVHLVPRLDIGVTILEGAAKTTVFLNVDGSAGLDFTLSAGADVTPVSGTIEDPVLSLSDVQKKFGGSVGADLGVSVNAGATAALVPFFDQTVSVELFSKKFPLFKACLWLKHSLFIRADPVASTSGNPLICPASVEFGVQQPILEEVAPAPSSPA